MCLKVFESISDTPRIRSDTNGSGAQYHFATIRINEARDDAPVARRVKGGRPFIRAGRSADVIEQGLETTVGR